jgi:hypothetical protein
MKMKFLLSLAALVAFMAVPVFAQHGGHGGGHSDSMHASSSSHSHDADGHGDHDGKDADDDHGHHGHDSSHNIASKLASNTQLASKLQGLLPPGTNLQTAAQGFKNLGQFVAAVHVSKNLGIPFDQLKAAMIGPPKESLGKAVQQLDPGANAKAAVKTAEKQAHQDLESTEHDNDKKEAHDMHDAKGHDADNDDATKNP